jgi:disulfide bond formation protein DsbB
MPFISTRQLFLLMFIACAGLLGAAYYFEYVMYLDPCPLCVMQRIAVLLLGLIGLSGSIFGVNALRERIHMGFLFLASCFGMAVAGRHVWIQSLPADQVPTCGPSLEYMVDTLPWADVLAVMLRGNGNCADAQWSFIGLSMPQWVLVWFVGFAVVSVVVFVLAGKKQKETV